MYLMKKINLTSEIYKDQTPGKAKPKDESSSYHNVCCPNCRYLFKVPSSERNKISQNQRNADTAPTNNFQKTSQLQKVDWLVQRLKDRGLKDVEIQTQSPKIKVSPKTQVGSKMLQKAWARDNSKINLLKETNRNSPNQAMTDRTPQRSFFYDQRKEQKQKSSIFIKTQQHITISQIIASQKQQPSNEKISNLAMNKGNEQKFPARSAYLKPKQVEKSFSKSKQKSSLPFCSSKTPKQSQDIDKNNLIRQLLQKIELTEDIQQIIEYNLKMSHETSIPSYCKMLIYDVKDRNKAIKNTEEPGNTRQDDESKLKQNKYTPKISPKINRALQF